MINARIVLDFEEIDERLYEIQEGLEVTDGSLIEIIPEGEENVEKLADSIDRGDDYQLPESDMQRLADHLALAILKERTLDEVAEETADAVSELVSSGGVTGPDRSPGWIRRKGHNNNMVGLTGQFAASLRGKVVPK